MDPTVGNRLLPIDIPEALAPAKVGNATVNGSVAHSLAYLTPFCSLTAETECANTSLMSCTECSMTGAAVFMSLVAILGFAIVFGNCLVLLVVGMRSRKDKLDNMDYHRVSLALADLLTGVNILVVTGINFEWTLRATPHKIKARNAAFENSAQSILASVFFTLTFISSVYNLALLAGQRLYAFVRPIHYKFQTKRRLLLCLVLVWIFSILAASVPAWFRDHFDFSYYSILCLFFPSLKRGSSSYAPGIAVVALFYLLPYLLTTSFVIAAICVVRSHLKRAVRAVGNYGSSQSNALEVARKSEVAFLKSTTMMQIGFTLTVLPGFVVVVLYYAHAFSYNDIVIPYVVCIYLAMSNSLVNVFVYSIGDSKFRKDALDVLCCCCGSRYTYSSVAVGRKMKRLRMISVSSATATASATKKTTKISQSSTTA